MPEPQLLGQQHRGRVEDVEDFLEDPLRLPVYFYHYGGVNLLGTKGDNDSTAHPNAVLQGFGQAVGIGFGQGEGQNDVC